MSLAHPTRLLAFVFPFFQEQQQRQQQTAVSGDFYTTINVFLSTRIRSTTEEQWGAAVETDPGTSNYSEALPSEKMRGDPLRVTTPTTTMEPLPTGGSGDSLARPRRSSRSNRRGEIFAARLVGDHVGGGSAAAGTVATSGANECALLHPPTTSSASLEAVRTHFGKKEEEKKKTEQKSWKEGRRK